MSPNTIKRRKFAERNDRRLMTGAHPFAWVLIRAIRRKRVVRLPKIGILVNDPSIMRKMLSDTKTYIKNGKHGAAPMLTQALGTYSLMNTDGDEHKELRRWLLPLMTPATAKRLSEEFATEHFTAFRDAMCASGEGNIITLSRQVASIVVARLVGYRSEGAALAQQSLEVHRRATDVTRLVAVISWRTQDKRMRVVKENIDAITEPTRKSWELKDPHTVAGLLATHGVPFEKVRGVVASLLLAGVDTTAASIARMVALVCDSGELTALHEDESLRNKIIEETLRYTVPVPLFTRSITCDHAVDNIDIPGDRQMMPIVFNCLHNETVVEHPDTYDVRRAMPSPIRKLWFGAGPHFCPGHAIAGQLMSDTLELLTQIAPDIAISHRKVDRKALLPQYRELRIAIQSHAGAAGD